MLAALLLALAPQEQETPPPTRPGRTSERLTIPNERWPIYSELHRPSADLSAPLLVLFHQARSSKGEYRPIVPHLLDLGYACLAVDLSCGRESRDVKNQTAKLAAGRGFNPSYLDGLADMRVALTFAHEKNRGPVLAWGSSYSAALALVVAAENPDLVDGVVAFSPGEYFTALGKSATWVQETAKGVHQPVLLCSARGEEKEWRPIFDAIPGPAKTSFLPEGAGTHGSSALWEENAEHEQYWKAVETFLAASFPVPPPASSGEAPK